ncbi:arginase [Paenibacillus hexagrammi]|uniref:Arginase n=1 Tax=Paenibacillus hexagrammi TaxID=2908839 RepID=A0ABY3SPU9_9BACL|nr:arginase [Paenibacillus sp. YPD9-1]UJF35867.1 arginase [Paenibacillus sp. YPD9-1]
MNPGLYPNVAIIGVPMDLGADRRGVDMGPSAIRCAGLEKSLLNLGYQLFDQGDLVVRRHAATASCPSPQGVGSLKYLDEIARVNGELSVAVDHAMQQGMFPLVLGGDHSIAIGSLSGVRQHHEEVGVIWFDSHGDVNTASTSPSGNIHGMSLAVALGHGDPKLTAIGGDFPKVKPEHVAIVGARSLDPGEKAYLKQRGILVFTMHEIDRLGMSRVMEQAIEQVSRGTSGVHLSLDLDGLDPGYAPGVGTPVPGGLTARESFLAMEMLSDAGVLVSAEFVEINPILDHRNQTAKLAVSLIASLFGERIL